MKKIIASFLILCLVITQSPPVFANSDELSSGFLIVVESTQDQKISGSYRINFDGNLYLPYDVTIPSAGLNLSELKNAINEAYSKFFKGKPNIQISVKQKRYFVDVRGMIKNPGNYLIKKNSPLDEIISQAGGLAENQSMSGYVRIDQNGKVLWINLEEYFKGGDVDSLSWTGGEKIFFQKEKPEGVGINLGGSGKEIHILGEVKNPGTITYLNNADVYDYIVKTGGPTQSADLDQVELIRTDSKTGTKEQIELGSLDEIPALQESDILIIHADRQSSFQRFLQGSAIVTSILSTALLGYIAIKGLQ